MTVHARHHRVRKVAEPQMPLSTMFDAGRFATILRRQMLACAERRRRDEDEGEHGALMLYEEALFRLGFEPAARLAEGKDIAIAWRAELQAQAHPVRRAA